MKCYFTKIDSNFNFRSDIIIGPWCLDSTQQIEKINILKPYKPQELFEYHKKLFDLSYFLLNKDIEGLSVDIRKTYYLHFQRDYLFLVFFSFSKYRLIRNILDKYKEENIEFEKIEHTLEEESFFDLYFSRNCIGLLCYEIAKNLIPNNKFITFNSTSTCQKTKKPATSSIYKDNLVARIKKSIIKNCNYFSKVKGIGFFSGLLLSITYYLRNIFSKHKKFKDIKIYNPDFEFDEETEEFANIFEKLTNIFIDKKSINNISKTTTLPKLIIEGPNFIYNKDSLQYAYALTMHKTNLIIMQHGALYASVRKHFAREIEYNWGRFFSWGKCSNSYLSRDNKINSLPYPYLSSIANKYRYKNQNNILWITGVHYKSGDGLEYYDGFTALEYMRMKINLFKALQVDIQKQILYKSLDTNSDMFADRMLTIIPRSQQLFKKNIIKCMTNTKLVILDYYGTPFYEAMSLNVPIVAIFLESHNYGFDIFTNEAREIFNKLKEAKIIYESIFEMQVFLNNLPDYNIFNWWNSIDVQTVRKEFLDKYANNSSYLLAWLINILKGKI